MTLLEKIKGNIKYGLVTLLISSYTLISGCNLNKIGISPDQNKAYFAISGNKTNMESMGKNDSEIYGFDHGLDPTYKTLIKRTNNDVADNWVDVSYNGIVYMRGIDGPNPKIIYTDLNWENEKELAEGLWPLWWNEHVIYMWENKEDKKAGIYVTDLSKNIETILSSDENTRIILGWPAILKDKAYFCRVKSYERKKEVGKESEKENTENYEIISIDYKTWNQETITKISEEDLKKEDIKELGAVDLAVSNDKENIAICFVRNYWGGSQSGLYNLNKGALELLFKADWVYYPSFSPESDLVFLVSDEKDLTSIYHIDLKNKDKVTRLIDLPGGMGGAATAYVWEKDRSLGFYHICNDGFFAGELDLDTKENYIKKVSMEDLLKMKDLADIRNELKEVNQVIRTSEEKIKAKLENIAKFLDYRSSEELLEGFEDYKFEEPKEFKLSEDKEILNE